MIPALDTTCKMSTRLAMEIQGFHRGNPVHWEHEAREAEDDVIWLDQQIRIEYSCRHGLINQSVNMAPKAPLGGLQI